MTMGYVAGTRLAVLLMGIALVGGVTPPTPRPNFLVILADDLDAASFDIAMPRAVELVADAGLRFTRARVSSPLCCPSRASILRGQYTHNHGVVHNGPPDGGHQAFAPLEHETIAAHLQGRGYVTGWIGKYFNGYGLDFPRRAPLPVPTGWSTWSALLAKGTGDPGYYYDYSLNLNGHRTLAAGRTEASYSTDRLAELVDRAIRSSRAPWFIVFAPYAPHFPSDPAPRHAGAFEAAALPRPPSFDEEDVSDKPSPIRDLRRLNAQEIAWLETLYRQRLASLLAVDEAVERFLQALRETGQLGRTYVFVTSDNGYHLGQHRQKFGKATPYAEDLAVPLVVRGPDVPAGAVSDALVLNVDLAPTLARLARTQPPAYMDGRSFARILRGGQPRPPRRVGLVEMRPWRGLRTPRYAYTEYPESGERELYDLETDPHELDNLAATASPCLLDGLATRLGALAACAGDTCRSLEAEPLAACP
jgi:arylsulfatase A-like enzyme